MNKGRIILFLSLAVVVFIGAVILNAQNVPDISGKQDELSRLRETIKTSEAKLKQLEQSARKSEEAVEESRRQAAVLDTLVTGLQQEEKRIANEMIALRRQRDSLDDAMAILTEEYVTMARALFRQRLITPPSTMLLLPAEHRKLGLREKLFERYAVKQHERALLITRISEKLRRQDALLAEQQKQQQQVIEEKLGEMERLTTLRKRYSEALKQAESEKSSLEQFLQKKEQEAKQIEGMIARLIRDQQKLAKERERRRKAEEARERLAKKKAVPESMEAKSSSRPEAVASSSSSSTTTSRRRARSSGPVNFTWPVASKNILHAYGERKNPQTNTVTLNPGVNISASSGSAVKAAEDGTVSLVSWLPSYGTVVIVEHNSGYRTVYANLSAATVSRGTDVLAGDKIGTVGQSVEGEFLHFEVWQGQQRLDPMTVLQ